MSSNNAKLEKLKSSLYVPVAVAGISWLSESTLNYATGARNGMHFTFKSFFKNMLIITTVGVIIEYNRDNTAKVPPSS